VGREVKECTFDCIGANKSLDSVLGRVPKAAVPNIGWQHGRGKGDWCHCIEGIKTKPVVRTMLSEVRECLVMQSLKNMKMRVSTWRPPKIGVNHHPDT
jgi:hypothetical protein